MTLNSPAARRTDKMADMRFFVHQMKEEDIFDEETLEYVRYVVTKSHLH